MTRTDRLYVTPEHPACGIPGRDWAGRLMPCTDPFGHYRTHHGAHGGRLTRERDPRVLAYAGKGYSR